MEGPFGDHYGYYSLAHPFPVFQVDRIYHRKNAIFPATVVGRPRQEDHYIGEYLQDLFAPLYPLVMNGVQAVWAYDDAGVHPLAAAVVKERYPREAFMAGMRILGEGQLSLTKFLLITDEAHASEGIPSSAHATSWSGRILPPISLFFPLSPRTHSITQAGK